MARQRFGLAMALLLPKLVVRSDLHLLQSLLREMAKPTQQPGQGSLALLVQAKRETRRELLQGNLLAAADWRPPLLAAQARLRDLFLHSATLRERQHQLGSLVPRGRARRCSRCPDPSAFFQETPAVRKCNRAARCGDFPISVRCRLPRSQRALAGCDNKCSRSQRKRARRARTFPIAAADKYRCLLRPIAD